MFKVVNNLLSLSKEGMLHVIQTVIQRYTYMTFRPDRGTFPGTRPGDEYDYITQPLTPEETPDLSPDEQLANAHFVAGALHASLNHLTRATRGQDRRGLVDTSNAWMSDITHSIIRGRQITVEPIRVAVVSPDSQGELEPSIGPVDRMSLTFAGLLRNIAPREHQIGFVTVVNDAYNSTWRATRGQKLDSRLGLYSEEVRRDHLLKLKDLAVKEEIIGPGDIAGKDYSFITTGDMVCKTDQPGGIIHDLRLSEWGEVKESPEGLTFYPYEELRTLFFDPETEMYGPPRVRLSDKNGVENYDTLHAQAMRHTMQQTNGLHVASTNFYDPGIGTLLRAVGSIDQQRYHSVQANWHHVSPEHYALKLAEQLEYHTHEFIGQRNHFASFETFDPYEYAMRNYGGEKALADDQEICRVVTFALQQLNIQARSAADIGCGPNPYPGMLLLPHADVVDLLEYSKPNRDYMEAFFSGTLSLNHTDMWRKFGGYMVEGGGDAYANIFDDVREAGQRRRIAVKQGDVFNLPQNTWDLISAYFVVDSISIYREDHHRGIASLKNALTEEGLLITANMLNRKDHIGYNAGENKQYPNISQNVQQMRQAYIDNDMSCLVIPTGQSQRKARDGYDGMALVLACHKHADLKQKLITLAAELKERGFTTL
jgi:hypothetical protein